MSLYSKFCAWLSGWPEGTNENKKIKTDEELFKEEKKERMRTAKKPKGLKPKKKKKSKK